MIPSQLVKLEQVALVTFQAHSNTQSSELSIEEHPKSHSGIIATVALHVARGGGGGGGAEGVDDMEVIDFELRILW